MLKRVCLPLIALLITSTILPSQTSLAGGCATCPDVFSALKWRCIGPHRGGRTVGASGVPQQPGTFYMGVNNGGVWKTTDYGRVWEPIFDDQPTGSIGDVAVAPSDPTVIYVASGEGLQRPDLSVGNGVYRSGDAGKTWVHTGLEKGLQIGGLAIDPTDPNRVFVAVLGHPYGPNEERGVYRTTNGGKNWDKVKYIDENTGAMQVAIDPNNPKVVYADFWANRLAPWENGEWRGPNSGLWKSIDGGNTWKQLTKGLPGAAQNLGRIGFCICPSMSSRLYATVDCGGGDNGKQHSGIYRSDDSGDSWYRIASDGRLWGRGDDFAEVTADPKNPDIVYSANVVTWKSTNGGKSWEALRGAPGGDDYHRIWINPDNPEIMLIASDQGAIITVNGGKTFSSWYNQPTAQFYHVSTDNAFPYNVYSGQQESGSVGIASRGNDGQITFREWHSVGAQEYGYVAADPLDPNIIYGGKISKYDKRTGQTQDISPEAVRSGFHRFIRTAPIMFSPVDPHTLYYAGNVLFKTQNGGDSWDVISPDLSRETWAVPECVGIYSQDAERTKRRRGVIYALAPSQQDTAIIWAGTDDGLLHLTRDGGANWTNISPPSLRDWDKVSQLDAGHFDANTCYAAINSIRRDDYRPHILRTHDGGITWEEIVNGIPDNEPINTVREDPVQEGLLYAGSENAVYVSFDDGDHWQSLRLNMPATSIRDLVVKDDDLVIGTHGRSFWILDNITPLREDARVAQSKSDKEGVVLYPPQVAYRVRWNMNTDTPLPQEEPAGENPPDGAAIDYYLPEDATNVTLKISDLKGAFLRNYTMFDPAPDVSGVNFPLYWVKPFQVLSNKKGAHRFYWDLHYDPILGRDPNFPISAIYGKTAPVPQAPWVMPGIYNVVLEVDGQVYEQQLKVVMDPRVTTSMGDLQKQLDLSISVGGMSYWLDQGVFMLESDMEVLNAAMPLVNEQGKDSLKTMQRELNTVLADSRRLLNQLKRVFSVLQDCDMPPTSQTSRAVENLKTAYGEYRGAKTRWSNNNNSLLQELKTLVNYKPKINQPVRTEHPAPDDPEFRPLFQNDLSNAIFEKGIWEINANGELTASKDQCIFTQETFEDFTLDLEFKTAEGTNSGVIVHCSDTDNWIPNSVEIQIADDFSEEWSKADPTWQCGAIFGHLAATKKAVKHPGEWNRYTITCVDRQIWVILNGEIVTYMDMSRWLSGNTNPDGSGIPPWLSRPFATLPLEGHIGFQGKHAGAPIWFRNVRVKKL
ncbi:MAG: DUF1080 domain-containing protein [Lewinellaceae bacterium]|nr:DUF1080 domain-containing protein [Saprospiraceae bacterium]MCB9343575.1 DUF1080 domain-containing protein [Lewinellaceae bacterium]